MAPQIWMHEPGQGEKEQAAALKVALTHAGSVVVSRELVDLLLALSPEELKHQLGRLLFGEDRILVVA